MVNNIGASNVRTLRPHPDVPPMNQPAPAAAPPRRLHDHASLSVEARELSLAREAIRQAPETRPERIAALRQRIEAGTYHVPDALLAHRLLDIRV
jgi:flagellar biosynthesis anti-sigma factor FlgM